MGSQLWKKIGSARRTSFIVRYSVSTSVMPKPSAQPVFARSMLLNLPMMFAAPPLPPPGAPGMLGLTVNMKSERRATSSSLSSAE